MSLPWARRLGRAVIDLVYPPQCLICDTLLVADRMDASLCESCLAAVGTDPHNTCSRCASTVGPHMDTADGCPRCWGELFRFDGVTRLGSYEGLLRAAVLRAKHLAGEPLAEVLGCLLARQVQKKPTPGLPAVVVPVPLHWRRRWSRGYNQSAAIGHAVAAELGVPCRPGWLVRWRNTPLQTSQSAAARRENVRGAFRAGRFHRVQGLRVLLVDDVLTTGATADAAAVALRDAGAAQVQVAVLAHR